MEPVLSAGQRVDIYAIAPGAGGTEHTGATGK